MRVVAALYIDPRGPYPAMLDVDAWDETRNARLAGRPEEHGLAPLAVGQVRQWGGVLEHPWLSGLWPAMNLPVPGAPPDAWGGWSLQVEQVSWGHVARKPTRLYFVGVDRDLVMSTVRTGGEPTHCIGRPSRKAIAEKGLTWPCVHLKATSSQQNRRTPQAFAEWLVMLARSATPSTLAVCPASATDTPRPPSSAPPARG